MAQLIHKASCIIMKKIDKWSSGYCRNNKSTATVNNKVIVKQDNWALKEVL